jgi:hypoxanthine phosphoribosyltransferase
MNALAPTPDPIVAAPSRVRRRTRVRRAGGAGAAPPAGSQPGRYPRPAFAHESEAELSRILDFYAVSWEYEPHTFPILWNLDGEVVESFSPDFYLPELDLYLELTTLRQKLVRKKNRKLRRLRELYPGIQIKLFYARDFRALMLKYGKPALAQSLSGTLGQVGPGVLPPPGALVAAPIDGVDG